MMDKLLLVTPVVMTVIATLLAGLASSEMTRAQYDRAYAAQLQSKAGDQWNYFQAKKLRGFMQRNTIELLKATTEIPPLDLDVLETKTGIDRVTLATLETMLASGNSPPVFAPEVKVALDAVAASKPDAEVAELLKPLPDMHLATALEAAKANSRKFDADMSAVNPGIDQMEKKAASDRPLAHAFAAVRMQLNAARYDTEARLNQVIANIYELQVRKSNISAERHHKRSGNFFFGMLAAQAAVVVSTFSLAAQKRNFLWSVAAVAGLLAIAFAIYVFLYI
jgi:hypothetical protein